MKKIFLLPLLSVLVLFSCGNKNPEPDPEPTHDELSEYTTHVLYNKNSLIKEEKITWENHHIVQIDGTNYDKDGLIDSYAKDTYKFDGNDEIEHVSTTYDIDDPDDPLTKVTTNTYDSHHNVTHTRVTQKGELGAFNDYEYTYDNAGNILTSKDSRCGNASVGHYNYVGTTTNTYDNKSRLLTSEIIATHYSDKDPSEVADKHKRIITYTYQGDYKQYVTYQEEIHNILDGDVLESKTSITNELDNHGYPTHRLDEMFEYNESRIETKHTKTETYAEFYDNGYEYSHQTYDLLVGTDTTLIEDYTVYYNNNNFSQKAFELTYNRSSTGGSESLKFIKNKYDSKNRLFASEEQKIENGKVKTEIYDTYGYDD
ncbi:MAG: hypothetical protein MJ213_02180 [Bacilli bacterium]|nr:hypothetical protein [Bacilli bacterium]